MKLHHTDDAPQAAGPYSQAVSLDGWLFTAGQLGIDPSTGKLAPGGFEAEARQALANLRAVLRSAGADFDRVLKTTVFLADLADFRALNAIFAEELGDHRPARTTVQVAALPLGAAVEIDMVARS
ncbi:MAG TPA: Rid family detoxifying hydrolase [Thermoanaerobaculia bacterium]|nr:Rid family detoxifying hydrolase [Thermoanaerobaculia bacterium]